MEKFATISLRLDIGSILSLPIENNCEAREAAGSIVEIVPGDRSCCYGEVPKLMVQHSCSLGHLNVLLRPKSGAIHQTFVLRLHHFQVNVCCHEDGLSKFAVQISTKSRSRGW